jgi:hypothetical protein
MQPIQLLHSEATMLEALQLGQNIPQIATSMNVDSKEGYRLLHRLIFLGFVTREGRKHHYTYTFADMPYVVVTRRVYPKPALEPDPFLDRARAYHLTADQLFYLRNHRYQKRTILAKRLGLSKLELNFALDDLGGRRREYREAGEL